METNKNKRWKRFEFNWQLIVNEYITLDLTIHNLSFSFVKKYFVLKIEELTPFDVMFWIKNIDKSSIVVNFYNDEKSFFVRYVNLKLLKYTTSEGFHKIRLQYGNVENTLSEPSVTRF